MKAKQLYPIYHDTMAQAIEAAYTYVRAKGFEPVEVAFMWNHVAYGETSRQSIELTKDGQTCKKSLHVQLYRLDSGKYELNAYMN